MKAAFAGVLKVAPETFEKNCAAVIGRNGYRSTYFRSLLLADSSYHGMSGTVPNTLLVGKLTTTEPYDSDAAGSAGVALNVLPERVRSVA